MFGEREEEVTDALSPQSYKKKSRERERVCVCVCVRARAIQRRKKQESPRVFVCYFSDLFLLLHNATNLTSLKLQDQPKNIQCHHCIPSLQIEDCSVSSMPAIAQREMESSQCRAGADGEALLLGRSPIPVLF